MRLYRFQWLALVLPGLIGCGPTHIAPFTPRERKYEQGEYAVEQDQARPARGSIYTEGMAGYLEDTRAVRIGDIVMVRIDEQANAKGGASTDLSRTSNRSMGMNALLGLVPAIRNSHPNIDPAELVSLMSDMNFQGDGQTSRDGTLKGVIAVRVKKQLPNEDLFVEGTKVVMINQEEYHLYISGLIRPTDIEGDNSVPSWRLADAQVEFTGRGDIASSVDRGWLAKVLDAINPF
ncbi:MAG TPA: flagellar basal body L-ring protein FlgH [Polyangiaceae bacterium]|nr:flagellar basal body L-ring protein FlgH [Polyangiaceae bacterium]